MDKSQPRNAISTNAPKQIPAEGPSFLGLPNVRQLLWITALGVVVTWVALLLVVPLVSHDPPITAPWWQRLQDLLLTRPTTVVFLLALAVALVLPNFAWLYVLFVWLRILPPRTRALHRQHSADAP